MSEARLREVNGIAATAGVIKAGSTLLIPRSAGKQEDVTAHVADNGQLTMFTPKPKTKPKAKGRGKASPKAAAPTKRKINAKK